MLVVGRCSDGDAAVPSNVVKCTRCQEDCWISKATGAQSMALAEMTGDKRIICGACLRAATEARIQGIVNGD
jgi:hypothetical protein